MDIKNIINKIKNKKHLDDNKLEYIINTYGIYTETGYETDYCHYMSTLCKLDDLYIVIYWDKNLNKRKKTKYYQPIIITNIKTKYLHIITLEDNSSYAITVDNKLFNK